MRDATPKEVAVNELLRLLAPVLTHGHGMRASEREARFKAALEVLCSPQDAPTPSSLPTNHSEVTHD